jgi:hypothetical protein
MTTAELEGDPHGLRAAVRWKGRRSFRVRYRLGPFPRA